MIKYIFLLAIYIPFYILAMLIAPILPIFTVQRDGPVNNGNGYAVGPRLPKWLAWFDTSYDNSLDGDGGWRENHCPDDWPHYWGRVKWLWRNPANGFAWYVLSRKIADDETFSYTHSGNELNVDKGKRMFGWYSIKSSSGAFSFRWCKQVGNVILSFEAGWLLDVYIKSDTALFDHPRATFQFQPQIKRM